MCAYRIGDCNCVAGSYRVYTDDIIDPTSPYDVPFEARNLYTHTHTHTRTHTHTHAHTYTHTHTHTIRGTKLVLIPLPTP